MGKTLAPARGGQPNESTPSSLQAKRRKHHSLMGQVLDLRRLRAAYEAVRKNHGAPGVDGITVEAFGENLEGQPGGAGRGTSGPYLPAAPRAAGVARQAWRGTATPWDPDGSGSSGTAGGAASLGADL